MNNCVFCEENRFPFHKQIHRNNDDLILYEDNNLFVTVDISPVCLGHILLITKQHICNFFQTSQSVRKSVVSALDYIKNKVYMGSTITMFEHGSVRGGESGSSVDHAHIHVVPGVYNLVENIENDKKYSESYVIDKNQFLEWREERPYIAIYTGDIIRIFIVEKIESQYMRYVLAKKVGNGCSVNWRTAFVERASLDMYDETVAMFNKCIENVGNVENTEKRLRELFGKKDSLVHEVFEFAKETILRMPFEKASKENYDILFDEDYQPGLFWISEREMYPDFLLEENEIGYEKWFISKIVSELNQITVFEEFHEAVYRYGIRNIVDDVFWIFNYSYKNSPRLVDKMMNQVYSDFFRRAIMFLISGSPFTICNNHKKNNELTEKVGVYFLSKDTKYTLKERLKQSLYSGVIGMNLKEAAISTGPISLSSTFEVSSDENTYEEIFCRVEKQVRDPTWNGIDDYSLFEEKVMRKESVRLSWITDDYLATMFEMRFMDEIMDVNEGLSICLIPRFDSYSNDASYDDIMHLLSLSVFESLHQKMEEGRFVVCRNGCDISTFDGLRMSRELSENLISSDYVVISGARAFEMGQGIKKDTFFTGIAVCKGYTESITGFDRESGAIVFIYQPSGEKSFRGFKDRASRVIKRDGYSVGYAVVTAREYASGR